MNKLNEADIWLKYFILIFAGIFSLICMINSSEINGLILSFLILPFSSMCLVRFNLLHPYVWYGVFFSLYTIGYPILLSTGENNFNYYYGYSNELFYLHWIAIFTFFLVVSPNISKQIKIPEKIKVESFFVFNTIFYWLLTCLSIMYFIYIQITGISSKVNLNDASISSIGVKMLLIYVLVTTIEVIKLILTDNKKLFYRNILVTFTILILIMFFTAERDLIFRFILVIFYIYYIFLYKKNHKVRLFLIGVLFFLSIPLSRSFKFFWIRGETDTLSSNLLIEFINSEFHTQSRNVQLILNSGSYKGILENNSLTNAFLKLIGIDDFSVLSWFQNTFYYNKSTGMGFSLVGEGYLNSGYFGVLMIFLIISLIIKYFYNRISNSLYYLIIYLLMIPVTVYTIRADFNNFLSQSIKQVILAVVFFVLIDKINFLIKKRSKFSESN
ncbi:O-antigen polymerase [Exiguobacterium sp. K1]|uniref:O-antigen polymerase n=1 Tax=Exiguobacterium sp. K1 TaxID=2980105 RepID=UPI00299EB8CE|nr:O-antigen polymerase [Exiguobacterium sp. K1]MDX1259488.1 oligosaccharide repeat unit polymerase [Exiguobacterium sp. K1]